MIKFRTLVLGLLGSLSLFSQTYAALNDIETNIEEAKKLYTQALPLEMNSPEKNKLLEQAESILKIALKDTPDSLEVHRKLVGVYILKQDYTNAIRTMQSAIRLSPEDPQLFVAIATFYQKKGALDLSKEMLNQALILDPNHQVAKDYKMVVQKALDDFDKEQNQTPMDKAHGNLKKPMDTNHGKSPSKNMAY